MLTVRKILSRTSVLICLFITTDFFKYRFQVKQNLEPESNVQNLQTIKLEVPWATEVLFFFA